MEADATLLQLGAPGIANKFKRKFGATAQAKETKRQQVGQHALQYQLAHCAPLITASAVAAIRLFALSMWRV